MNSSVLDFYKKDEVEAFFDVILIDDTSSISFEEARRLCFDLPKGWFELCQLPVEDRIEFSRDFCLKILPFKPHIYNFMQGFFSKLDNIAVFLTKKYNDEPYRCELVYSLKNEATFFRGNPPCSDVVINNINQELDEILPRDFLEFLKVHNGFAKNTDTGIIPLEYLKEMTQEFQNLILNQGKEIKCLNKVIDPEDLMPFYQCFGRDAFQCFYLDWYPEGEIGNVYYSGGDRTISNYNNTLSWAENLAFPSFLDWLIFYLEEIEF